jgi:hypothetical protein
MTNHAKWSSGSRSRSDGGITKACSTPTFDEVLGHGGIVFATPDGAGFIRHPRVQAVVRRVRERPSPSNDDDVLERKLRVLDLVADEPAVLMAESVAPSVAFVLAAVAGFSQLFSP